MKYNIDLLKADIADELNKLARLEAEFDKIKDKLGLSEQQITYYDRGAIGYLLHNFYNGCENIFQSIARFFENDFGPQTWHKDLLKRMRIEVKGFRPAIIDEKLFVLLDDFRGFRHKFRHSYAFDLDWEREKQLAKKLKKTSTMFQEQISDFMNKLDLARDE